MYIHVKVIPGSKKEEVTESKPGYFIMKIKEKAEHNMANDRVIKILQDKFSTKNVRLINGHQSPSKLFTVGD
ncbi:MAG: DUF167 family protein [Candidatus Paceibacterota bacterium]